LQYEIEEPKVFGWFHLTAVAIIVALCALVVIFRKKISKKFINITLLVVGIILIISEVFKQLIYSMDIVDGAAVWDYSWRTFPFQFCSVPIYVMLIAGILRKGKVYDTLACFLATYSLFGGLSVILYPSTVLSTFLYSSIHTFVWHGAMLIVAIMLISTKTVELKFKTVLKATIVFLIAVALAEAMNIIWHYCGTDRTFSMFYISPYYKCDIPVLSTIKENAPYFVFLLAYILGFIFVVSLIMAIVILIDKLCCKISAQKAVRKANATNK
jgi:hypothetical protein